MSGLISNGFTRLTASLLAATLVAAMMLSTARAADETPQTPQSKEQIETLISDWHHAYDGTGSLAKKRAAFETFMDSAPGPTRIQIRHLDADGVDADLIWPARLHHPIGRRVILYLHGGGFYSGSSQTHMALAGSLAKSASSDVLVINYRRTPEATYPAPADDAITAYRWLLASGYENSNIVIVGDSVGGTLAIETVLKQMRLHGPLPAAVVALSPITDFALTGASITDNAEVDPVMNRTELEAIRKAYIGWHKATDPDISPLYADMTGFPPLLLQVGSLEVLEDDTTRLADKARKAGVDVVAEVWPGMIHQWQIFPFRLDDADRANARVAEFAIEHFADKPQE